MTSLDFAASNGPEKNTPAVGMVPHLKRLIETLPGCVMRTDLEGCLLAANDSALQLLGVTEHAKVLTKSLTERISAEHAEDWRAFLRRSWSEGASSVECELVDFTGDQRFILFKSVAQPQHFDGTESLILTAQDLASRRRLERALNEHQGCAVTIDALRTELQLAEAEHQRVAAQLEGQHSSPVQSSSQDATNDSGKQQVADLKARLAAKEKEWQTRCDELTAQVAQHDGERQRMATMLDEQAGEHRRATETAAERDAAYEAASEALRARVAELEQAVASKDQEGQKRCDDLIAQLAGQAAEQAKLSAQLAACEAERQRLSGLLDQNGAEHTQLREMLEQKLSEQQTEGDTLKGRVGELEGLLKATEQDWQKRSDDLTAQLAEHAAARLQLTNVLSQRDTEHRTTDDAQQHRISDLEASLKGVEQQWQNRCSELTARLAEISSERERLANLLDQRGTDHRATSDNLQQRIGELERSLKANEEEWQKQRATLSAELAAHVAEQARLSSTLKERDEEAQGLAERLKERDAESQRLSEALTGRGVESLRLSDSLKERDAECQRVSESVKERDVEIRRVSETLSEREAEIARQSELLKQLESERKLRDDEHRAAVEGLQQQIVEFERALTSNDEAWKHRCEELSTALTDRDDQKQQRWDDLSAQLVEHSTERKRLSELLQDRDLQQQRLVDQHAAEKTRLEQTVRGECEQKIVAADEARRREIENLRQEMGQLAGGLRRTSEQLAQRTAESQRLTAELQAYAHIEVNPADVQRLTKSVAAYRIELLQATENTIRTLEPMATAGRFAIASSRELQAAVGAFDARSKLLLEHCGLDDVNRPEIERLRRDAINAASLVRQLLQVLGDSSRATGLGPQEKGKEN